MILYQHIYRVVKDVKDLPKKTPKIIGVKAQKSASDKNAQSN